MKLLKKKEFKNKREAYSYLISCFTAPLILPIPGIYLISWYQDNGPLTRDATIKIVPVLIIVWIIMIIFGWYQGFAALITIQRNDFEALPEIPETVICVSCQVAQSGKKIEEMKCPECGGQLEDLSGFYKRHSELK
jgi:hypothetical protein